MILHAGLVALRVGGTWRGALIAGSSGSGKSDLMLRSLQQGLRLVSDDRTLVWSSGGRAFGRAPETLAGLIEARGLGVLRDAALPMSEVSLMVRCVEPEAGVERLPGPAFEDVAAVPLPVLRLRPLEASSPVKLSRALQRLGQAGREA